MDEKKPRKRTPRRLPDRSIDVVRVPGTSTLSEPGVTREGGRLFRGEIHAEMNFCGVPLRDYLTRAGLGWVVRFDEWIGKLDLTPLLQKSSGVGRAPMHPRIMLSLILYGMLRRQWSLRELEQLALADLGAMFLCRGEQPDHSTIGNFMTTMSDVLSDGAWFTSVVRRIASELDLDAGHVAIDGTVIEAVTSRFNLLGVEAAKSEAQQARKDADAAPDDVNAQQTARDAEALAKVAEQRAERREEKGQSPESTRVARGEPEAVVQPRKDGAVRPAFKPSVAAIEGRVIVGHAVHPSSETTVLDTLVDQCEQGVGTLPKQVLLDAGYFSVGVLKWARIKNIQVLCPSGRAISKDTWEKRASSTKFPKHLFVYQPDRDQFICPAGRTLESQGTERDRHGTLVMKYRGRACGDCPKRAQCTDSKTVGRTIKRYEGDELKDATRELMAQPLVRARYRRRAPIVEPVFAELRERQGLKRFRRRGLRGATLEFALHCLAFNMKRAERLQAVLVIVLVVNRKVRGRGNWICVATAFSPPEVP